MDVWEFVLTLPPHRSAGEHAHTRTHHTHAAGTQKYNNLALSQRPPVRTLRPTQMLKSPNPEAQPNSSRVVTGRVETAMQSSRVPPSATPGQVGVQGRDGFGCCSQTFMSHRPKVLLSH